MLDEMILQSLSDKSFFSNPYPLFDTLREQAPVHHSSAIGGWILTRHEDVDAVLRNSDDFSSKGRVTHLLRQLDESVQSELPLLHFHFSQGLAHSDAPEHRRLRGLLARAFTPRMIEKMRPRIHEIAEEMLESLSVEVDLIEGLLTPLPARIVGELLGSDTADIPDLIRWAQAINGLYEKGGKLSAEKAIHAEAMLAQMRTFVNRLVAERQVMKNVGRLSGEEDVLSALVMQDEGALSEDELLSTMVSLFVAGHETTTHLLGNGWFALLERPDWLLKMREEPELIPLVVEEMARFDGSVPRSWRLTKRDVEIRGVEVSAGELVLPMLAAANRDATVFASPGVFDPLRENKKHVAYGRGVHACIGAPLARLEAQELISVMVQRFINIEFSEDPGSLPWREDLALRGLLRLPVRLK